MEVIIHETNVSLAMNWSTKVLTQLIHRKGVNHNELKVMGADISTLLVYRQAYFDGATSDHALQPPRQSLPILRDKLLLCPFIYHICYQVMKASHGGACITFATPSPPSRLTSAACVRQNTLRSREAGSKGRICLRLTQSIAIIQSKS